MYAVKSSVSRNPANYWARQCLSIICVYFDMAFTIMSKLPISLFANHCVGIVLICNIRTLSVTCVTSGFRRWFYMKRAVNSRMLSPYLHQIGRKHSLLAVQYWLNSGEVQHIGVSGKISHIGLFCRLREYLRQINGDFPLIHSISCIFVELKELPSRVKAMELGGYTRMR